MLLSMLRQQEGAILLSYLHEMKTSAEKSTLTDTPIIHDHDYHLALKQKILGVENEYPPLKRPRKKESNKAKVLRKGIEGKAGFKPGTAEKIRKVCQEWFEESEEPFMTLVARHGVVILHEPFGEWEWGRLTRSTPTEMASLTLCCRWTLKTSTPTCSRTGTQSSPDRPAAAKGLKDAMR